MFPKGRYGAAGTHRRRWGGSEERGRGGGGPRRVCRERNKYRPTGRAYSCKQSSVLGSDTSGDSVQRAKRASEMGRLGLEKKWPIVWHSSNAGVMPRFWALRTQYLNNANAHAGEELRFQAGSSPPGGLRDCEGREEPRDPQAHTSPRLGVGWGRSGHCSWCSRFTPLPLELSRCLACDGQRLCLDLVCGLGL